MYVANIFYTFYRTHTIHQGYICIYINIHSKLRPLIRMNYVKLEICDVQT